jgi:hypothetical protein
MMATFNILENGKVVNTIVADLNFVQSNFTEYEEVVNSVFDPQQEARVWRIIELQATDWIAPIVDHPQHAAYLTYRQALRDWPDTPDFPETRPTLEA